MKLSRLWLGIWLPICLALWFWEGAYSLPKALSPGHDAFGRSLALLIPHAAAQSLLFAAATVFLSTLLALSLGSLLALQPRPVKFFFSRVLEFLLAFPPLLIALSLAAILGPGLQSLMLSLTFGTAPAFIRFMTLRADEVLQEDYLEASVSLGATRGQLMRAHLFPALLASASVKIPNLFAQTLLAEATLSYLGLGVPLGEETWGTLLAQGRDYLIEAPSIAFFSGLPLILTVLALQILSEQSADLFAKLSKG